VKLYDSADNYVGTRSGWEAQQVCMRWKDVSYADVMYVNVTSYDYSAADALHKYRIRKILSNDGSIADIKMEEYKDGTWTAIAKDTSQGQEGWSFQVEATQMPKGEYAVDGTVAGSVQPDTQERLQVAYDPATGELWYQLLLPDITVLSTPPTDNGTVNTTEYRVTSKVEVTADVAANETGSTSFRSSDTSTIALWGQ
jgi:hypothetical protein